MADGPSGIGEFVVDALLGEGGMGKVYRARQVALDRWVALKVLAPAKDKKEFVERFYREARSAAALVHPSIVQIYTVGEHDGIPFFAMEYVDGLDLEKLFRKDPRPLSLEETIEIVRNVAKALGAGMEHNIVHRDIKPGNIMLTKSGLVKVMDFGLAKSIASVSGSNTNPGLIVGTPAYMSPEQGAAKSVDIRSDIYSLGCVMYRCLCDCQPFQADSLAALIYKHTYEEPVPPRSLCPGLSPEVEKLCLRMMAKKPEDRFQDPKALLEALAQTPANPAVGEVLLAKRVSTLLGAEKEHTAKAGAAVPGPAAGAVLPTLVSEPAAPPGATGARVSAPRAPAAPEALKLVPAPPPQEAPKAAPVQVVATTVFRRSFQKLPDGRWSYKSELVECGLAEGLAAAIKPPRGQAPWGLGDCLLCTNWNKYHGCAVAYTYELEARNHCAGLKLLVEQAAAWTGTGNFEKAILILDNYVKENPEDPEGYRELARLYDRPDYKGRDKRRAIVLYQRFVELARAAGGFTPFEISRAVERANALMALLPEKGPSLAPGSGVAFQCFYHGAEGCFGCGVLTAAQFVMARAGNIDPESGLTAAATGPAMLRAGTTILRYFKSGKANKEERARVREELARLSTLAPEELAKDPACVVAAAYDELEECSINVDEAVGIVSITVKGRQTHLLAFTTAGAFKADQCYELLRRKLAKPQPACRS